MTTRTSPDGRSHRIDQTLLARLNALPFYTQSGPKSLGREWVEAEVYPLIDSFGLPAETVLATFVEHVAMQIARHVRSGQVLMTGVRYVVPNTLTVDFKEALIFAFLGALYVAGLPNCLASVTGAAFDNIGGFLYKGSRRQA